MVIIDASEAEDLEWIRLIREQNSPEKAYEALHRKYLGLILGFLGRQGFGAEAHDLAQDIFFSAFRELDSFEERSTFRTWLIAIAANRCRREWSRSGRLKRKVELVHPDPDDERQLEERVASSSPQPEEALLGKEAEEQLAKAIEDLPPRMRQVWRLREQGHDIKTIAVLLKVQEGTIKAQIHHARAALAEKLVPAARAGPPRSTHDATDDS